MRSPEAQFIYLLDYAESHNVGGSPNVTMKAKHEDKFDPFDPPRDERNRGRPAGNKIRRLFFQGILVTSMVVPSASFGQTNYFCAEPDPPYCVDSYGTFDDEWSFSRCRNEVEYYLDDIADFQRCLSDWFDAAGQEADDIVERFNCRAQGRSFCP